MTLEGVVDQLQELDATHTIPASGRLQEQHPDTSTV